MLLKYLTLPGRWVPSGGRIYLLRLNTIYRSLATCTIGDGSTVCFWDDLWMDTVLGQIPKTCFLLRGKMMHQSQRSCKLRILMISSYYHYLQKHLRSLRAFKRSSKPYLMMITTQIVGRLFGVTNIHHGDFIITPSRKLKLTQFLK